MYNRLWFSIDGHVENSEIAKSGLGGTNEGCLVRLAIWAMNVKKVTSV